MRNYFILFYFLFTSIILYGQTEPIEKIEYEPDPIMMDAYDFATGKMNDVKWMFKGTLDNGPRVGFEYKLNKTISVNIQSSWLPSYFLVGDSNPLVLNNLISLRYYLNHQDRISNGQQGNNLNGSYLEFGTSLGFPGFFNIYQNAFVGVGMQSRFLKHGMVDTGLKMQYFGGDGTLRLSTGFDLGLAFSKGYSLVEMEENKCAIVRCYDEQFFMLKIPISRLLFFSYGKTSVSFDLRPSVEFEHRISRVGLSMNHEIRGVYEYVNRTDTVGTSLNYLDASYRMGIRWYVGKKKRIIKGKTSNNLSGFYLGPVGEIGVAGGSTDSTDLENGEFYSIGLQTGFQTRLLKNLYVNFHLGFMGRDYFNTNIKEAKELIEARGRSLLVDDGGSIIFEAIPLGGLIVGYTF